MEDQQIDAGVGSPQFPSGNKISWQVVVILIFLVLFVSTGIFLGLSTQTGNNQQSKKSNVVNKISSLDLAPYTLVYGVWNGQNSDIKAFDLSSGDLYNLASLPSNIKEVSVLDKNKLLYIGNTDNQDYGQNIFMHTIVSNSDIIVVKAAPSYGIDSYVISPNKRYLADWEVVASSSGTLFGGQSRVYTVDLQNPQIKHLIYSESALQPVHYPLAILDNGTVYTDTFLPNSGAGWAYGMSVSNFYGTQKQDLADMRNGTYGTQPVLSPDGKYLAFAGYDGSKYPGTVLINGFRQSVADPDTIELLDTSDNQRVKLAGLPNTSTYMNVQWNSPNTLIYYNNDKTNPNYSGIYTYNLVTKQAAKLSMPKNTNPVVIAAVDNTLLVGKGADIISGVNNLGAQYQTNFSKLFTLSKNNTKTTLSLIPLPDEIPQYITLLTENFYKNSILTPDSQTQITSDHQLRLGSFAIKPSLAPVRLVQQSNPIPGSVTTPPPATPKNSCATSSSTNCYDAHGNYISPACEPTAGVDCSKPQTYGTACSTLSVSQCPGASATVGSNGKMTVSYPSSQESCIDTARANAGCAGTPLYLYGTPGEAVDVIVHTSIFNSDPPYKNGYKVVLGTNGKMIIGGVVYQRISSNYIPDMGKLSVPDYGTVTSQTNLINTVSEYARGLGLNTKETRDLVAFTTQNIHSPYVFFSFYNDKNSKEILPLTFSPQSDVYRNIVFYFKQLDQKPLYSIAPPKFNRIQRHGLTAIEISEVIR